MSYATVAAYVADPHTALDTPPTGAALDTLQMQLDDASDLLDDLLVRAVYSHGADGQPTDLAVITALSRACVQQALFTAAAGDDEPGISYTAVTLGPLQLPGGSSSGITTASQFSPRAVATLTRAGLITSTVRG